MICPFEHLGDCWGPFERHHAIPRQTIRNNHSWWHHLRAVDEWREGMPETLPFLEEALTDERNLVTICQQHHERVTNRRIYVTREMLPAGIDEFAATLGLGWYMDRFYDHEGAA